MTRLLGVQYVNGYVVRVTFSDGLVRELDLEDLLHGPVLQPAKDPALFSRVTVDAVAGTIQWPNGVD